MSWVYMTCRAMCGNGVGILYKGVFGKAVAGWVLIFVVSLLLELATKQMAKDLIRGLEFARIYSPFRGSGGIKEKRSSVETVDL